MVPAVPVAATPGIAAPPASGAAVARPARAATFAGIAPQAASAPTATPTPVVAAAPAAALAAAPAAAPATATATATASIPTVVAALPQEPVQAAVAIDEAPSLDQRLAAEIEAFLSEQDCARIERQPGSTNIAALVTSEQSRERLQAQLAADSVGASVDLQIEVVQPPFCSALLALPIAVEGRDAMALNNDDGLYVDGELLALSIGPVPVTGHLYVVFVDHDGSVQYLVPSEFETQTEIAADGTRALGAEQDILDVLEALGISIGNWRASPPFGRGLVLAFVTENPLAPAPEDAQVTSARYFAELAETLADNPARWARYRWIDTRPRD